MSSIFGSGDTKAAAQQEDFARSREEREAIRQKYLSQLPVGSKEYAELQSALIGAGSGLNHGEIEALGSQLVQQFNSRVASGEAGTAFESRTDLQSQRLRDATQRQPFEEDIFRLLQGTSPETAFGRDYGTLNEALLSALTGRSPTSPIGQVFARQVGQAASPTIDDTVFKNALQLVEDQVKTRAARRGILGSGLELEDLGRTGVEASIAEALRQDQLRQQAYTNAAGIFDTGRGALSELFNVGEGLRTRDIALEEALTNLQLGRETNLTQMLNQNQNLRLDSLNNLLSRFTGQATADRLDAADTEAARRAAVGQGIGTVLGNLNPLLGQAGGQIGSTLAGGGTQTAPVPQTSGQLLASQQSQRAGSSINPSASLSRTNTGSSLDLSDLLKLLAAGGA